jgi:hypothetical protein
VFDGPPSTLTLQVFFTAELGAPLGDVPSATLDLTIDGHLHNIAIAAQIVAQQTTQVALVLDCSDSMNESRGDAMSLNEQTFVRQPPRQCWRCA